MKTLKPKEALEKWGGISLWPRDLLKHTKFTERCWLFQKKTGPIFLDGTPFNALAESLRLTVGKPPAGVTFEWSCGNQKCISPGHVFWVLAASEPKSPQNPKVPPLSGPLGAAIRLFGHSCFKQGEASGMAKMMKKTDRAKMWSAYYALAQEKEARIGDIVKLLK